MSHSQNRGKPIACRLDAGRKLLLLLAILIVVSGAYGQTGTPTDGAPTHVDNTATKLPVYDVVSIRPTKSGDGSSGWQTRDDSYSATNVSVKSLLAAAYGIKEDLISGVTGPINSARFDVIAKMVEPDPAVIKKLSKKQRQSMLLPFLMERFQLKAHTEIKTLPVYELVVVEDGPKFKPSPDSSKQGSSWGVNNNQGILTSHDTAMLALASQLTDLVHRTVIDKTGLTGNYEISLKWSQYDGTNPPTDSGPSIFTALQEQLGLKLKPAKGPVETLAVDHVAMPSEN